MTKLWKITKDYRITGLVQAENITKAIEISKKRIMLSHENIQPDVTFEHTDTKVKRIK